MSQEYSASMAAKVLGVTAATLKQWEKHFPDLALRQDAKGGRLYGEREMSLLKKIVHLVKERGFTVEGAKREMERPVELPGGIDARSMANELKALRRFLNDLKDQLTAE